MPSMSPEAKAVADAHAALAASKRKKTSSRNAKIAVAERVAGNKKTRSGKPSTTKHVAGGAAAGAATGAMVGNVVPGIGTAIGAGVGAGVGAVGGAHSGHKAKKAYRDEQRAGGYKQLLIGELIVCLVITGLSPLTDKHKSDSGSTMFKRFSSVAVLFMILGFVSSMGRSAAKLSASFGGIVTLVLVMSDADVFVKLATVLSSPGKPAPDTPRPATPVANPVSNLPPGWRVAPGGNDQFSLIQRTGITERRDRLAPLPGTWGPVLST
jgi:hypothetical protein